MGKARLGGRDLHIGLGVINGRSEKNDNARTNHQSRSRAGYNNSWKKISKTKPTEGVFRICKRRWEVGS